MVRIVDTLRYSALAVQLGCFDKLIKEVLQALNCSTCNVSCR